MQSLLKRELDCSLVEPHGSGASGCISKVFGYRTDKCGTVFVKSNDKEGARLMFDGEFASLEAIAKTDTVRVPKPIKVFNTTQGGSVLVMEYLDLRSGHKYMGDLGKQLANLHLHNRSVCLKTLKQQSSVHSAGLEEFGEKRFGFHCTTCCGFIGQDNTWENNWLEFFARNKLQQQLDMVESKYSDREASELWVRLQRQLPQYFKDLNVFPSLLHGDLWSGNVGALTDGPVIFDAASFYGHHEFDLGIAKMWGGLPDAFWDSYHTLIPKALGFNQRNQLYQLFHYLNHWNHFGNEYRSSTLELMKQLS